MDYEARREIGRAGKRLASLVGAGVFVVAAAAPALALDPMPPQTTPPATPAPQHFIFDSTPETNSFGNTSLDMNLIASPFGGAYESGFRFRLTGSLNWYRFINGENPRTFASGRSVEEDLVAGYLFALPRISILALAGGAAVESNDDGRVTRREGPKAVVSFYATPTDQTMAYGNYFFLGIDNAYQFQNKVGWKVPWNFYLGPEITFSGNDKDATTKIGGHLSGLNLGPLVISISAGVIHDQQLGDGKYVSVNFYGGF